MFLISLKKRSLTIVSVGRFWPAPLPTCLLSKVGASLRQKTARFESNLLGAPLSFLWDHQVQGRPLLPGSALFDIAHAVGRSTLSGHGNTLPLQAAVQCSIAASVPLTADAAAMILRAETDLRSGHIDIQGARSNVRHFVATSAQCWQSTDTIKDGAASPHGLLRQCISHPDLGRPAPYQVAELAVEPAKHQEGFYSHPAIMDSCLHLGASLDTPTSGREDGIRVPIGADACISTTYFSPYSTGLRAQGRLVSFDMKGSAFSNYRMDDILQGSHLPVSQISGLQAKPVKLKLMAPAKFFKSAEAAVQPATKAVDAALLYQVAWETHSKAPCLRYAGNQVGVDRPLVGISGGGHGNVSLSLSGAGELAAASMLAGVQHLLRAGSAGAKVQVASRSGLYAVPGPARSSDQALTPITTAVLWGMTRVAASETPGARWAVLDMDRPFNSLDMASAGIAEDVAGSGVSCGRVIRPMLRTVQQALPPAAQSAASGKICITGGLGGAQLDYQIAAWS